MLCYFFLTQGKNGVVVCVANFHNSVLGQMLLEKQSKQKKKSRTSAMVRHSLTGHFL